VIVYRRGKASGTEVDKENMGKLPEVPGALSKIYHTVRK
jgi:hypothetical protein